MLTGIYLFHNTNRLNRYVTEREQQQRSADYEKKYKPLAQEPQPRIVGVKVQADLYPGEARVRFQGTYSLENRSGQPVQTVYVNLPPAEELQVHGLTVAGVEKLRAHHPLREPRRHRHLHWRQGVIFAVALQVGIDTHGSSTGEAGAVRGALVSVPTCTGERIPCTQDFPH